MSVRRMLNRASNVAKGAVSIAVGGTTAVGLAATVIGIGEGGRVAYHYYTDTEMQKKHFWSKPVEVYCRNGQPVKKIK